MSELLDYTAEDMTGMSLYALCHGEDVHKLKSTHEDCKCTKKSSEIDFTKNWKFDFFFFFSVEQRPSDEQLLSHLEQIRRILLDAIVRHFDLQHEKRRRAKYHLRQLCLERTPIRQHCHGSMSNRKQAWD